MRTDDDQHRWVSEALQDHERDLIGYATHLLRGDVNRARDVVQDTFLRLWKADRQRVDGRLRAWLFTVCRNRALDVLRKDGRMTMMDTEHDATPSLRLVPAPEAEQREQQHGMMALVDELPPRQQEAVRLKFQNDMSYREISEVMETTVSNVGVLIHTALKTLREKMNRANQIDLQQASNA